MFQVNSIDKKSSKLNSNHIIKDSPTNIIETHSHLDNFDNESIKLPNITHNNTIINNDDTSINLNLNLNEKVKNVNRTRNNSMCLDRTDNNHKYLETEIVEHSRNKYDSDNDDKDIDEFKNIMSKKIKLNNMPNMPKFKYNKAKETNLFLNLFKNFDKK